MALDRSSEADATVARLKEDLAALERAYSPGHHGLWVARRRATLVDATLVDLYALAAPRAPRTALAALGGYGRGALTPRSDIDLLLLHDDTSPGEIALLAERLLYPLWDAGFAIGHAVRTPAESSAAGSERLDALTALLDARPLAGDQDLFRAAAEPSIELVRADPDGFAERLGAAALDRRDRYGSAAYLLEPELKDGGGGLRDVASFGWLEAAIGSLEDAGLLRARERESLDAAEEFLTRTRSALHLETGKRTDRLVLEHQPTIARAMGFGDEPRLIAEDGLMRALFEHTRFVDWLADEILIGRRRAAPAAGPAATGGPVDAASALSMFRGGARTPTPNELDAAEALQLPDLTEWTDEIRDEFLALVRQPGATRAIEALDRMGIWSRLIPEWRDVRCRPQRDPYHRLTVDRHLVVALDEMSAALREQADDSVAGEAVKQIIDADGALLGALLHDIGKNGQGAHVPEGVRVATAVLGRMRLPKTSRDLALFMVGHHLLLPDTATRRDLTDDDLILDVAAKVGTPERLAALYLLSKADGAATGPAAATEWRATLIRELVAKVQRVFERGEMGEEVAQRLAERINDLRDLLHDRPPHEVDAFVLRMPRGYFLTVDPEQAARHFAIVAPFLGQQEVRTAAWPGARPGTHELLVVAADRPGLLSWIAGCLALEGLSILTANVFTTEDGAAVDLFEVEGIFEPDVREDTWRGFRNLLRKAIEGRVSLDHKVPEKRDRYPRPKRAVPVTVAVDNDASDFFTVIELGTADRIGLLYEITRTLAELELDVHLAKIATYADRVIDAFYVRDAVGRKVTDPDHVAQIKRAIRERLDAE
ncbi:MAG TPA: HD domain-containing protein [Actinomycetota bacterium]|jgi:[protein-PII] uridylyltransferase|nr:HD domain-containing protein [Actinomycetota bacterium]